MILLAATIASLSPPPTEWPAEFDLPAVPYPTLVDRAPHANGFVPKGWRLDQSASGDLNRDGIGDLAIVIQKDDPANRLKIWESSEERYDINPRILLVAFGQADGGLVRVAADHRLITRHAQGNMDDPFDEIAIDKGVLRLDMHVWMSAGGWWMGSYKLKFRWQDDGFWLIGYDRDGIKRNTLEEDGLSINYLTRTRIRSGSEEEGAKPWSKRERLKEGRLLRLDEIGDALMFDADEK